jgi:uncharacterized membrane protein
VFFNTLTVYLVNTSSLIVLLGLILLIVGWVFSGQKYAVALREKVGADKQKPVEPKATA